VVENVCGAQKWVGRAAWHYGSYYLWGDVPALMPHTLKTRLKCKVDCSPQRFDERIAATPEDADAMHFKLPQRERCGVKGAVPVGAARPAGTGGTSWFFGTRADPRDMRRNEDGEFSRLGIKQHGSGPEWFDSGIAAASSRSQARKAASALIAEIPFDLAQHIARCFKPAEVQR
jgi:hypothetical protein